MYGWAHQPPVTKPCSGSGHWPGAVVPPMLTHGADARARWRTLGSGDPPRTLRKDDDINRSTIGESVGPVSAAPPALTPKLVLDTLAARDTACATIATRCSKDDLQRVFDTINADGSAPPCGCAHSRPRSAWTRTRRSCTTTCLWCPFARRVSSSARTRSDQPCRHRAPAPSGVGARCCPGQRTTAGRAADRPTAASGHGYVRAT